MNSPQRYDKKVHEGENEKNTRKFPVNKIEFSCSDNDNAKMRAKNQK